MDIFIVTYLVTFNVSQKYPFYTKTTPAKARASILLINMFQVFTNCLVALSNFAVIFLSQVTVTV